MDADKEKEAVEQVAERLAEKFPDTDRAHIEEVVHDEYEALDGARIRDYIPVLVEHEARADLIDETRSDASAD
ncbi:three-helix bundle dimerization domain-containing protein [Subtercola sp. YIM 133946]|uniref:three-helix bundle dimerization domain-containing protein n=1 Tax=Subtercola sp. YIM 133946 TaxID=3118909 RepID=UPI002F954697